MSNDELVSKNAYAYWRNGTDGVYSEIYKLCFGTYATSQEAEYAYVGWVASHPSSDGWYSSKLGWCFE